MSKLPTQLKWNQFVRALTVLKYEPLRSKGGSARHFQRGNEDPVTFHEPHNGTTIPTGTLTEYLRKLKIDRRELELALAGGAVDEIAAAEEQFRRTSRPDGSIVSNCLNCLDVIVESFTEDDVALAEQSHICPSSA